MNEKQREIILNAYEYWLNCGTTCNPASILSDLEDFFNDLKKTDEKLRTEMQKIYDGIPEN